MSAKTKTTPQEVEPMTEEERTQWMDLLRRIPIHRRKAVSALVNFMLWRTGRNKEPIKLSVLIHGAWVYYTFHPRYLWMRFTGGM